MSNIVFSSRALNPYGMLDREDASTRVEASNKFRSRSDLLRGIYSNPWGLNINFRKEKDERPLFELLKEARKDAAEDYHDVIVVVDDNEVGFS